MSNSIIINFKKTNIAIDVKSGVSFEEEPKVRTVRDDDKIKKQLQAHFEMGFNKGYETALNEMQAEYEQKISLKCGNLADIFLRLENTIDDYEKQLEEIIINAAYMFAEKIVQHEIKKEPETGIIIKESLKKISGAASIKIKLCTEDYMLIGNNLKEYINDNTFSKIVLEEDNSIEEGGCFIETEIGNIDARLSTRKNELKRILNIVEIPAADESN